jgi:hypothetical protein
MGDPRQADMPVFTDDELDAMSIITPEDVERAREAWDRDSGLPGLLDAEATDEDH